MSPRSIFRVISISGLLLFSALFSATAIARTWRITPDGTGDAPTLQAAMDSTVVGDTVLVAPGEYPIIGVDMAPGVLLTSEEGPFVTRFIPVPQSFSTLACAFLSYGVEISGIWFDGFPDNSSLGAVSVDFCWPVVVRSCLFTNNAVAVSVSSSFVYVENCTFVGNENPLHGPAGYGECRLSIFWDSFVPGDIADGYSIIANDVLHIAELPSGSQPNNFSIDPQFCGPADFRLSASSPLAPGNPPYGSVLGLIGALPVGCAATAVEQRSWGAVKALYRN